MTIWKYQLAERAVGSHAFHMPRSAKIPCVQLQDRIPTIWALCDPSEPPELRMIVVVGTGWTHEHPGKYIGTIQNGSLVWHVFESIA